MSGDNDAVLCRYNFLDDARSLLPDEGRCNVLRHACRYVHYEPTPG